MVKKYSSFFIDEVWDENGLICDACARTIKMGESYIRGIGVSYQNICEYCVKDMNKMMGKEENKNG